MWNLKKKVKKKYIYFQTRYSTLKNMITIFRLILCKHLFQQSQFYTDGYFLLLAFFKLEFLMIRAVTVK